MNAFVRQTLTLFLALRAADLVNLLAALYLVPKFVPSEEIGAVLPVSTFATTVSIPAFAFALVFMREGACLAVRKAWGEWKNLVRGVFIAIGALVVLSGLAAALLLPRYLRAVGVSDTTAGALVLAGAFLGCVAPVYTNALNALHRFGVLGAIEIASALARLVTLTILMPIRALVGFFAGGLVQPLVRIGASAFALRRELVCLAAPYWTRATVRRLTLTVAAVSAYLAAPLLASLAEQSVIRISLGTNDSAAYYLLTRLSGLIDYLTLPLLFVLFPHAAAADARTTRHLLLGCEGVTFAAALALAGVYALWGESLLSLLPTGAAYGNYARHLPLLVGIAALNAGQVLATNAAIAAGRHRFLLWFVPLNLAYAGSLTIAPEIVSDLSALFCVMTGFAAFRFVLALTVLPRADAQTNVRSTRLPSEQIMS